MKTRIALILAALFTVTALAETTDQIAADYRAKAKTALEKVNSTLEKATVPIIAELVKAGDTTGADEVKTQLKAKQEGEPVMKPHAKAASLFALYDAARLKALEPIQQATIRKLDAVLSGPDGKKLEMVDAVKVVRAEVEAGRVAKPNEKAPFPLRWSYHTSPDAPPVASMELRMDGTWTLNIISKGKKEEGTWVMGKNKKIITLTYQGSSWDMVIEGKTAEMYRPDSGKRWLLAIFP
jgi:hypothetical protein